MFQVITQERVAKEAAALLEVENLLKARVLAAEIERKDQRNHGTFSRVILQSASCPSKQLGTLEVIIIGVMGIAYANTDATHSIDGETLYYILKKQGTTGLPPWRQPMRDMRCDC
ncbi:hypothetical protein NPIL_24901 [Nephila pilipes]|uniref:Uncharacterized protein n=1 Tax=Nephila pilipes TaxID=299642 RepID=A0A8X6SY39_NEPPI|nr:hypothetical protein NPIL_24901 [Nephila pilipes]